MGMLLHRQGAARAEIRETRPLDRPVSQSAEEKRPQTGDVPSLEFSETVPSPEPENTEQAKATRRSKKK